jgi:hypothetical protein
MFLVWFCYEEEGKIELILLGFQTCPLPSTVF